MSVVCVFELVIFRPVVQWPLVRFELSACENRVFQAQLCGLYGDSFFQRTPNLLYSGSKLMVR